MMGYTHFTTGVAIGSLIFANPAGAIAAGIGSLIPDIDTRSSIMGRKFPLISFLCGRHRGWVHSILGLIIFTMLLNFIDTNLAKPFAVGYLLHLLLDFINPSGIKFFYPIGKYKSIIGIPSNNIILNLSLIGISIFIIYLTF